MNLRARHVLPILMSALLGAGAGGVVARFVRSGLAPESEQALGHRGAWMLFGAVAGAAIATLVTLVRNVRDPAAPPPHNFTTVNGIGSTLIGRSGIAPDGSYLTTEWFVVSFIPLFPVCRYRVSEIAPRQYALHSKHPPTLLDAFKIYPWTLLAIALIILIFR